MIWDSKEKKQRKKISLRSSWRNFKSSWVKARPDTDRDAMKQQAGAPRIHALEGLVSMLLLGIFLWRLNSAWKEIAIHNQHQVQRTRVSALHVL